MEKKNRSLKVEKRKHKRLNVYHLLTPIQIKVSKNDMSIAGVLLDISSGGMGILSFKEIPIDSITELSINLNSLKTNKIKAKVAWIKKQENTYRIGLQFIDISKEDYLNISNFVNSHLEKDM